MPRTASHSRAARSAIASSTGCTSVGELEITRRISLIAVCCSSASFVSLNRRTFSIAIDRLVGERLQQRDLLVGERPRFLRRRLDRADGLPFAHQRHGEMARMPDCAGDLVR